ncbi:E3 SUMO-protein ligase KIAA1586 [Dissostichus eleginoides]|uniref:E3 SUMO-protein ligase KIAA1586 n=1 Tax=Dissostichus eleginoides TaxID=100907 RepID=A0AAD9B4G0_DISEL|nr:E3 SUMO-protein ligase KIAA1586 [Dissostichus eleginoides]
MTKFIKKLCARFMKPSALQGRQVHDILYKDPLNQLPGEKLNVGFTTRATLNRLLEAGDIKPQEQRTECGVEDALYFIDRFQELLPFHGPEEQDKVTGLSQFGRLTKIAQLVLVLPHSNADAERVFSMVGLNKTKTRNSLPLDGTLSFIMTVKMVGLEPNCFRWEPPTPVQKASKTATNTYNKKH